jgi:ATP phosphoribosyltransferase regulatory subunit
MSFPQYDSRALKQLDAQASAILSIFSKKKYLRVEPSILQPANVFLDRSGEEIRRRTFVLNDPTGTELCLRPDLTIPVCRVFLESRAKAPARYAYHGPAFRMQPNDPKRPAQFLQTGVECLGEPKKANADLEVLALAAQGVRAAGLAKFTVQLGDVGILFTLIDALDIPLLWRARLKRHFWRPDYFKELLARLTGQGPKASRAYLTRLARSETTDERAAAEGLLDHLGVTADTPIPGGRTREEIIERVLEQAKEAAAPHLDKRQASLIEEVLSVAGNARRSVAALGKIFARAGIDVKDILAATEARIEKLEKLGLDNKQIYFAPRFGRNMEYYTGFVFEFWGRDKRRQIQIAGGGRYDSLLRTLGAKKEIPAVGCAIWAERVLAARQAMGPVK